MTAMYDDSTPKPETGISRQHGREFFARYETKSGIAGSFTFRFNAYEFNTPEGQALHECRVLSESEHGSNLRSFSCCPHKNNARIVTRSRILPIAIIQHTVSMN